MCMSEKLFFVRIIIYIYFLDLEYLIYLQFVTSFLLFLSSFINTWIWHPRDKCYNVIYVIQCKCCPWALWLVSAVTDCFPMIFFPGIFTNSYGISFWLFMIEVLMYFCCSVVVYYPSQLFNYWSINWAIVLNSSRLYALNLC
jgi:hypothetical protein